MMPAATSVEKNITQNSNSCLRDQPKPGFAYHSNRNGAKIRVPAASPSHHVRQIRLYWLQLANPPSVRLVTPKVAATAELRIPAYRANRRMSHDLSKARRPLA